MAERNSHCSWCGHAFEKDAPWPRKCASCTKESYLNPIPVAVLLVPVGKGLLMIRRGIEPKKGMLALPGGYIGLGESWQAAGAREVFEETGIQVDPAGVEDFRVLSAPDGTVLVFGLAKPMDAAGFPAFEGTNETTERTVIEGPLETAFPLHTQVVNEYFSRK